MNSLICLVEEEVPRPGEAARPSNPKSGNVVQLMLGSYSADSSVV